MRASTYPDYENRSGWNSLLPGRAAGAALEADTTADLVVVGAGFTGLAAARRWADIHRDARVVVLESSEIGEGNPGRNSGFLLEISLANDADPEQLARMHNCNRLIGATMNHIRDAIFDGGIDCAIEHAGTYRAAAGHPGRKALQKYRQFLDAAALPYEMLGRSELKARLGTDYYSDGLYSPHCYLVQPAALVRGLAGLLPASVTIYENSPAVNLRRNGTDWEVRSNQATVTAPRVIVANNAFAKHLDIGGSRLVKMYTYAALTERLASDDLECLGSTQSWGLLPTHRLGCTLRRTRDDRLLIRSHYGYEAEAENAGVGELLLASLRARFPQLGISRFASIWGGATGFTLNGAPVWGQARPGLFVSAGCNGGGVVKGTLFGRLLAEHACGQPVPDIRSLFGNASWMPPEPFRRLGFMLAARWERRRGRAEM
jgi:glycine/D-amino acid oxidase-like deaminating enzyme